MNPYKTFGIIFAIIVVLCSATIANCKLNEWTTYKQSEITKSYLDLLEDEAGPLGTAGQKKLIKKALERSTK